MNAELPRCSICGARVGKNTITYTQMLGDRVYLVTDVPADVCSQCGEQYLSPETVDMLQIIIEQQQASEMRQVPVFHFPQPAA